MQVSSDRTSLGEKLTSEGVKADDSKVKDIQSYPTPQSKPDVLRLLGMVNFIAKFTPHVSDITAPLRELTKKDVEFHWLESHEQAFQNLKQQLSSRRNTEVLRCGKAGHYASRRLTEGLRSSAVSRHRTDSLRIESDERHATKLRPNREGTVSNCFRLQTIPSVRIWQACTYRNRPQTT